MTASDKPTPPKAKEFASRPGATRSVIDGVVWPGIPGANLLPELALQFQLERTQWWSLERLRTYQFDQLSALVRHAGATVPYYRDLFRRIGLDGARPVDPDDWAKLPLLTRQDIQTHGTELHSEAVPASHGAIETASTSGSTGHPVTVRKTALQHLYWLAITLRDHLWHERDFAGRMASLRRPRDRVLMTRPEGETASHWGRSTAPFITGPSFALSSTFEIAAQIEWLRRREPDYLLTSPSNLQVLAAVCLDRGIAIPTLRQVLVVAEALRSETREACRAAFGVEVKDIYSCIEAGYLALQSPISEQLLVQAETVLLEIIDDQGRPCAPGQLGRVVVTALHAFAMPLLRYELGDLAEPGGPATCGRGLPVIARVLGRSRDMVRLPDGRVLYPNISGVVKGFGKIVQWQVARIAEREVALRLVVKAPLDATEEAALRARLRDGFDYPFDVSIVYRSEIPHAPSGKFFEYVSEIT